MSGFNDKVERGTDSSNETANADQNANELGSNNFNSSGDSPTQPSSVNATISFIKQQPTDTARRQTFSNYTRKAGNANAARVANGINEGKNLLANKKDNANNLYGKQQSTTLQVTKRFGNDIKNHVNSGVKSFSNNSFKFEAKPLSLPSTDTASATTGATPSNETITSPSEVSSLEKPISPQGAAITSNTTGAKDSTKPAGVLANNAKTRVGGSLNKKQNVNEANNVRKEAIAGKTPNSKEIANIKHGGQAAKKQMKAGGASATRSTSTQDSKNDVQAPGVVAVQEGSEGEADFGKDMPDHSKELNQLSDNAKKADQAAEKFNPESLLKDETVDRSADNKVERKLAMPEMPTIAPVASPEKNPGFQQTTNQVKTVATQEKQHEPAQQKANAAQEAAEPPANEQEGLAQDQKTDEMSGAQPGVFNKAAFVDKMVNAVQNATPQNEQDMENFPSSGKLDEAKNQVNNDVKDGTQESSKDVKEKSEQALDTGAQPGKQVNPMQDEQVGGQPQVNANGAAPIGKTPQETNLSKGSETINDAMETNNPPITEEVLENSNEGEFKAANQEKKKLEKNEKEAPQKFQQEQQGILTDTQGQMQSTANNQMGDLHENRSDSFGQVKNEQGATKKDDEQKRKEVTEKINTYYTEAADKVKGILDGLTEKVNKIFEDGAKAAAEKFNNEVKRAIDEYKAKRYSGVGGVFNWIGDNTFNSDEFNNLTKPIYEQGKQTYINDMRTVAEAIATVIQTELNKAKEAVEKSRGEIKKYVDGLAPDLKEIGQQAQAEIQTKFEELGSQIDEKGQELESDLADKYREAGKAIDDKIKQMQDENKGLLGKAVDAIGGVLETINKLKDMLLGVLAKAAGVIGKIIKDPIGFLSNLLGALKQGLGQFVGNIGTHLKNGLMQYLMGEMGATGITMPETLDLKGILSIVLQVMGISYAQIRAKLVNMLGKDGESLVATLEKSFDFLMILATEGPAGLWKLLVDKVGDLKDMVMEQIASFITEKVVTAGVKWIMAALGGPAGAFIKACEMIYNVVSFVIENGQRLMEFVNGVLDGINDIADGNIGSAANLVEQSLARVVPLAISFLAKLIGVDGIGGKIKKIIQSVQGRISKVIDPYIKKAAQMGKKLARKTKVLQAVRTVDKVKKQAQDGIDKVKTTINQKVDQGINNVAKKIDKYTDRFPAKAKAEQIYNEANKRVQNLKKLGEDKAKELKTGFDKQVNKLKDGAKNAVKPITNLVKGAANKVTSTVKGAADKVKSVISTYGSKLKSKVAPALQKVEKLKQRALDALKKKDKKKDKGKGSKPKVKNTKPKPSKPQAKDSKKDDDKDTEKSIAVKQKARAMLRGELKTTSVTFGQVVKAASKVFDALQSQGLKSLTPNKSGKQFNIIAIASPADSVWQGQKREDLDQLLNDAKNLLFKVRDEVQSNGNRKSASFEFEHEYPSLANDYNTLRKEVVAIDEKQGSDADLEVLKDLLNDLKAELRTILERIEENKKSFGIKPERQDNSMLPIPLSSPMLSVSAEKAAKDLTNGKIEVYVSTRAEAEKVRKALLVDGAIAPVTGLPLDTTYPDATGLTGFETKKEFDKQDGSNPKDNQYHWDDATVKDAHGRDLLAGHPLEGDSVHGQYRHLQIHTGSSILRVFYGKDLWEAARKITSSPSTTKKKR